MKPKKIDGKDVYVCPKCGYTEEVEPKKNEYKIVNKIKHGEKDKLIIVDENKIPETLPKLKDVVYCPKCGNNEVYYWTMQTRAADEPPTRFYKCTKCGYVWREYE
ncbi:MULTISPECIES: transcription factor S [Fervidicoccus]|jgi:DNA-directed RNA polymerase subunit M|uniref:DNA-directed RNA polymerase, subunit M n=2 Tax=Fervidicoccus fontis TaxID=683846 RepID=I0A277_FERFK|nr:transcription factor S [Fervidicoccus fontis]AFH43084.1 DNA-directed RNA polymerase, subunit M [Fervidicoccus fontis Kam940]